MKGGLQGICLWSKLSATKLVGPQPDHGAHEMDAKRLVLSSVAFLCHDLYQHKILLLFLGNIIKRGERKQGYRNFCTQPRNAPWYIFAARYMSIRRADFCLLLPVSEGMLEH